MQSKHDALEKQRKELLAEKQKLDVERMRHVREVKLQWDYNTSAYNLQCHQGVLYNRYVLLNLFGKGGFAEVRYMPAGMLLLAETVTPNIIRVNLAVRAPCQSKAAVLRTASQSAYKEEAMALLL